MVGVDCGAHRAAFFVSSSGRTSGVTPTVGLVARALKPASRNPFLPVVAMARSVVRDYAPSVVAIEAPIVGASGNSQTAIKIAMTVGAVAAVFTDARVLVPAPATWKKEVVGHGHSDKARVAEYIAEYYPEVTESYLSTFGRKDRQDVADAFCLSLYAIDHLEG